LVVAGVVVLVLAVVGAVIVSVRSSGSNSASPSSSSPTTGQGSSGAPVVTPAGSGFVSVPGYTYTSLPAELSPLLTEVKATGFVTSVTGRGVIKGSGSTVDVAIVVVQYTPTITATLDKSSTTKVLNNAAKGAKAFVGAGATATDHELSGTEVRVLSKSPISMAVSYQKGGHLIEVFGPSTSSAVLDFVTAYLAARG
jgi:hypothetical protein